MASSGAALLQLATNTPLGGFNMVADSRMYQYVTNPLNSQQEDNSFCVEHPLIGRICFPAYENNVFNNPNQTEF